MTLLNYVPHLFPHMRSQLSSGRNLYSQMVWFWNSFLLCVLHPVFLFCLNVYICIYMCSNFCWWCNVPLFLTYFYKVCDGTTWVIKHVKQRDSGMIFLAACFLCVEEMKWKQVFQGMEHLQHLPLTIASLCRIVWHHVESHELSFLFQAVVCGWNLAFTEHCIVDLVPKGVQEKRTEVLENKADRMWVSNAFFEWTHVKSSTSEGRRQCCALFLRNLTFSVICDNMLNITTSPHHAVNCENPTDLTRGDPHENYQMNCCSVSHRTACYT